MTPQNTSRQIDPNALLRLRQVLTLVPISASSWWSGVRNGKYPKPLKLGPKTTCWRASDVLALIDRVAGGGEDPR
jgi:prophage regulatory protein